MLFHVASGLQQDPTFSSSTPERRLGSQDEEGPVHTPNKPSHSVSGRESRALETRERNIFQLMATFFSYLFTKKAFSGKS